MALTEMYIKDTLSKNERFVIEYLRFKEAGKGIFLGGEKNLFNSLEEKMKKTSLISHNELLSKLEGVEIEHKRAPYEVLTNGHEYDFHLKVPDEKLDYVKDLVAKAGYKIVLTNGGAKYAEESGNT